jgi:mono/diheme cytochrome c family protein
MPRCAHFCLALCGRLAALVISVSGAALASGQDSPQRHAPDEQLQFFEREVAPILKANCLSCHGGEAKVQGGLQLTSRAAVLKGGESGPAVSLSLPAESTLLAAIKFESFEMPPKGKLPQAQIDVLTRWVKMGLPWPAGDRGNLVHHGPPVVDERARNFWAFRPVERPPVPQVKNSQFVRNPIDAFILARLEEKSLAPAPPASPTALVRRLYYTVTGLPPTPEELEEALRSLAPSTSPAKRGRGNELERASVGEGAVDRSSYEVEAAYAALVDRLLASRHYGEHWGRHWLDLVRYAETNSFERDNPKPFVWRYRDYVIGSLNDDKPYDQFIREQLAGDELDEVTPQTIIATGYYRLGLWDDEPADPLLAYYDGLDDILATTGQTFLGLTVNCARCHDHKIDPFPQRDYYRLLAFFHGIRHYGERSEDSVAAASLRSIARPEDEQRFQGIVKEYEERLAAVAARMREIEDPIAQKLPGGERDDFKHPKSRLSILKKHIGELLTHEQFTTYYGLRTEHDRLQRERPKAAELALAVKEHQEPRATFVLLRGNPQSHGEQVESGFPAVLTPPNPQSAICDPQSPPSPSSGRRRMLADWIASEANPLTGRVIVNRVWQYHFGRGLVRTSSNFGYQGTPPTHPELLEWLTSEFVAGGMSFKKLHRLILLSNSFRMSGQVDPAAAKVDPENDLLSHFDLRRLSAEEIRDSILAVCGNLNLGKYEGPSVYPPISAEVLAGQSRPGYGWSTSGKADAAARSVFVHVKRSLALPILAAFDAPDPDAPCPVRFATTQPTQALGLLNSEFLNSQAAMLAKLALQNAESDKAAQAGFVLRRVLQRSPTQQEIARGERFIRTAQDSDGLSAEEAVRQFCLLALNLNEFVYVE